VPLQPFIEIGKSINDSAPEFHKPRALALDAPFVERARAEAEVFGRVVHLKIVSHGLPPFSLEVTNYPADRQGPQLNDIAEDANISC